MKRSAHLPERNFKFHFRVRFYIIVMSEFIATIGVSLLIAAGVNSLFGISIEFPAWAWVLVISAIIGGTATNFIVRAFIKPIDTLGKAMRRVAKGDLSVRLEPTGSLKEIKDINSNFNLMVDDLAANEKMQADFISSVTHEFKTPITAIEGYATLLQDKSLGDDERDEYIQKILSGTSRLSSLVGSLLLLSKLENGAILQNKSSFRLDEQIRSAIVALETKWNAKQIDIDADLAIINFVGYESLLYHAFLNLIDNAVKFAQNGSVITLRLWKFGNTINFLIEDVGEKIPESDLERIFERFYQSDSSHSAEGNGLGLVLVKQIVEGAQGNVVAKNTNNGVRFTVSLPQ